MAALAGSIAGPLHTQFPLPGMSTLLCFSSNSTSLGSAQASLFQSLPDPSRLVCWRCVLVEPSFGALILVCNGMFSSVMFWLMSPYPPVTGL